MQTILNSAQFQPCCSWQKCDAQFPIEIAWTSITTKITEEVEVFSSISRSISLISSTAFDASTVWSVHSVENVMAPIRGYRRRRRRSNGNNSDKNRNDSFSWRVLVSINNSRRDLPISLPFILYLRLAHRMASRQTHRHTHIVCHKND